MAKRKSISSKENDDEEKEEKNDIGKQNNGFEIAKTATYAIALFPTAVTAAVNLTKKGIDAAVESAAQIRSIKGHCNSFFYASDKAGLSKEYWLGEIKTLTIQEAKIIIAEYNKQQNFLSASSIETSRVKNELLYTATNDEKRAKTLINFVFAPGNESRLFAKIAMKFLKDKFDKQYEQTPEEISSNKTLRI